ncbi:MAG: hypothetical protein C0484_13870 [Rhodospirillum sp.]|nr:hypothetical protein [Rhodospirillum sp.]
MDQAAIDLAQGDLRHPAEIGDCRNRQGHDRRRGADRGTDDEPGEWNQCHQQDDEGQGPEGVHHGAEAAVNPAVLPDSAGCGPYQHEAERQAKHESDRAGNQGHHHALPQTLVIPGAKAIEFPFDNVVKVPSDETVACQDLALGAGVRLDAIVANLATTKERIDATGAFKIVGKPLYGEPNWVAIDKGDPEWEAKIIGAIKALRADGTLAKISQKWLGADITAEDL